MTTTTKSTCCYCGTGCGVLIHHDGARILGVDGDPSHPANFGRLCTKGSTLHLTTLQSSRALRPTRFERSVDGRNGGFGDGQPVSWNAALEDAADRFAAVIKQHGPDAVAF